MSTPTVEPTSETATVSRPDTDRDEQPVRPQASDQRETYRLLITPSGGVSFMPDPLYVSTDTERKFHALAEQWRSETMFLSLDRERACNFAYHQIIGMGRDALPIIFRELRQTTSDWFWALRAITGTDVEIRSEDKGNVHKIAEAWIEWGRKNGYVGRG